MSLLKEIKTTLSNEEDKNKQKMSILVIIFLILIFIISVALAIYAWGKYQSTIKGNATAQVAKWSFKLVDENTETSDVIDFALTRTDNYQNVVKEKLAPGTFGEFQIGIDARGTETILEYIINVNLENKPTNLKFYSDSEKTQEIEVQNNQFILQGFMDLEDVKEIKTITIYWDWPYRTGSNNNEIAENDRIDTEDVGKTMTMKVSVTGTQSPEMIVFSVEGITYYAEKGMTWGEWVEEPKYNVGGYYWNGLNELINDSIETGDSVYGQINDKGTNSRVTKEHKIFEYNYTHGGLGNSGGSND
ncbi:MAG: hypothetical protein J6A89_08930 [Clostridia bacterium]|nr:hypothetical protein [Clostridia bacterium]